MFREISKESLHMGAYLKSKKPGDKLTFKEIHEATTITMDTQGKAILRRAAKREGIIIASIRSIGIKLIDENTSMDREIYHFKKTSRQLKRHKKEHDIIVNEFMDEMNDTDKKGVLFTGAIFGQMEIMAKQGNKLFAKDKKAIETIEVPVPQLK